VITDTKSHNSFTAKKRVLFVNQAQFGYHIDYLQYVKLLKNYLDISYVCWDYGLTRLTESSISPFYISRHGNIIKRNVRFIRSVINLINFNQYDFIFIHYFRGASLLQLFFKNSGILHLDIRTGSVSRNKYNRLIYNGFLKLETLLFRSKSIISPGLQKYLRLKGHWKIIPLGANAVPVARVYSNKISLLYVGTLTNRRIEDTLDGLAEFTRTHPDALIHYTIVGDGEGNELQMLKERIQNVGLNDFVSLEGYVNHNEIKKFFEISNVGVTYIPITPYFNYQPSTKTYEYLLAGMPVIATETYENRQVVSEVNGVLVQDNASSFAAGLKAVYSNFAKYDDQQIRNSALSYQWVKIVEKMKKDIFHEHSF
jgi:hypothetical protein